MQVNHERNLVPKNDEDRFLPAAMTDAGCERELNEDRYTAIESKSGLVWLVCDGMGGVKGGELAAQLVIDGIKRFLDNSPSGDPALILRGAILEANRIIVLRRQNQAFGQMGTTLVGAIFSDREVSISHVGDSRAYLVGRNGIRQLTVDHTYVQELVNRGEVSQEDALHHPQAHVLTKAIGSEAALDVKASTYWIWDAPSSSEQDYLVMCTDGLYSMVSDAEIEQAVLELSPQAACAHLIDLSKQRGGYDNITLAVIPLTGELHEQAPSGYVPSARKRLVAEQKEKHLPADWKMFVVKNMLLIFGLTALLLLGVFIAILIFLRG